MVEEKIKLTATYKDKASAKVKKATKQLTAMGKAVAFVKANALALTAGFAAMSLVVGKLVGWFKDLITSVADTGDVFDKMSQKVGVNVEELSALKLAVELSGSSLEQLGMAFRLLSQNAVDFSRDMGEAKQTFIDFGIGVTNADGSMRGTLEIMMDFADAFSQMEDGALKTAAAQEVFGRSGGNLIPLLNQGSEAIREMMERSKELGVVWSTEDAAAAAAFNDSLTELKFGFEGLEKVLSLKFIPKLTELVRTLTDATTWANENSEAIFRMGRSALGAISPIIGLINVYKDAIRLKNELLGGPGEVLTGEEAEAVAAGLPEGLLVLPGEEPKKKKKKKRLLVDGVGVGAPKEEEDIVQPFEFLGAVGPGEDQERLQLRFEEEQRLIDEANLSKLEQQRAYWDDFNTMEAEGAEVQIEINKKRAEQMERLYKSLGQGLTTAAAKTMAALVQGQKIGGQQLLRAFGSTLGGIIGMQGEFHVEMGIGSVLRALASWPVVNKRVLAGGLKEIAQGTAMKGISFLGGGGGGGGGASVGALGGGGDFVGGGVLASTGPGGPGGPGAVDEELIAGPATEGSATLIVGHLVEQLRGHVVLGDLGEIVNILIPGIEEVIRRDNVTVDFVGV